MGNAFIQGVSGNTSTPASSSTPKNDGLKFNTSDGYDGTVTDAGAPQLPKRKIDIDYARTSTKAIREKLGEYLRGKDVKGSLIEDINKLKEQLSISYQTIDTDSSITNSEKQPLIGFLNEMFHIIKNLNLVLNLTPEQLKEFLVNEGMSEDEAGKLNHQTVAIQLGQRLDLDCSDLLEIADRMNKGLFSSNPMQGFREPGNALEALAMDGMTTAQRRSAAEMIKGTSVSNKEQEFIEMQRVRQIQAQQLYYEQQTRIFEQNVGVQIAAANQKATMERFQIMQETQTKCMETSMSVNMRRAQAMDKSNSEFIQYIRA